jgi:hypothetical protein
MLHFCQIPVSCEAVSMSGDLTQADPRYGSLSRALSAGFLAEASLTLTHILGVAGGDHAANGNVTCESLVTLSCDRTKLHHPWRVALPRVF